jgi:hypothetical protein
MASPESNVHSFILKLWFEEADEELGPRLWRGRITHVQSGAQRYIKDLNEIPAFIEPYLQAEGIELGWRRRLRQWLRGWRKRHN